jgi:hypothetical protein
MPAVKLRWFASSIQTVAGRVDSAHVGVPDAPVTYVGTADNRRAARSRLGPSTGGRGEQAQPGCLKYAVAAKRGLCGDVGVPNAASKLGGADPIGRLFREEGAIAVDLVQAVGANRVPSAAQIDQ